MSQPVESVAAAEVARLLTDHLQREEAVLGEALGKIRTIRAAVARNGGESLADTCELQQNLADLLADVQTRRQGLRGHLAARWQCPVETITVSRILAGMSEERRQSLGAWRDRLRQKAHEFLAEQRWLAIYLRIHLDAYQFLLCVITGTGKGSGRYGRAGQSEAGPFRPMIQVQG